MEKLQAALETARRKRAAGQGAEGDADAAPLQAPAKAPPAAVNGPRATPVAAAPAQPRPATAAAPEPAAGPVEAAWSALRPFEAQAERIKHNRVLSMTASAASTPFDVLRTKILLQMRQNGWTRLAITSALPQSGKTTTACNLGLGLARQSEIRTMLFDVDLRSPTIGKLLNGGELSGDLAEPIGPLLSGKRSFQEHGRRIGRNLAVAMSGVAENDPTRILLANQTHSTLDRIQADYEPDVMIFDLPSILVNDDTRAFLRNVDCALIVARADQTKFSHFDACEREVGEHTNVLGVVLNACRHGDWQHADAGLA